jgi:predicted ATPase/class 3 adenylate cyclase
MIESATASVTYLFSDIEGSTRLWEADPVRAARTLAWHDEVSRVAVQGHRGAVVKTTGDGVHAVFDDPADAMSAVIDLQLALAEPSAECAPIKVRCGLHLGADQRRDNDFFGQAVNRAARIMSAAHGGQVLLSGSVADRLTGRLPAGVLLRDLGTVRLRDLGTPERLFQLVHPALRTDFPPLRSMATTPNNLAQQLNSFIGRDREMKQVRELLANCRLLTLLGMGGLGKSRLSVQVAAQVLDSYPDGVWFVELASLSDPQLVPQAVASVLGVKEEPGGTMADALARFVRDRQLLIVFDNCEHLVKACAELARRLLEAGPRVKVLASSRDVLRVAGETVLPVPPLPAPDAGQAPSATSLLAVDSVRLFVDRARAGQPGFLLDDASLRAIAEICRRLDGIPLAIELAAARTRSMSVEQIAARLNDRFRLLSRGDRTALPRQQTLRALIDWSYDLLDEMERTLFRRLSVFAGGWSLEAAETVGAGGDIEREEVLDLLSSLVEKSLVFLEASGSRYRMLDTVRQYALEGLRRSADDTSTREAHLGYFLGVVEAARPHLVGPEQGAWMARLDLENENILAAHDWCGTSVRGAECDVRLIAALKHYWLNRGMLGQGYSIAKEAIDRPRLTEMTGLHARGLVDAGTIATFIGRYDDALRHLEQGLALARQVEDRELQFVVLQYLGEVELATGKPDKALSYAAEAETLARREVNRRMLAASLNARGQLLRALDKIRESRVCYEEALAITRDFGDDENIASILLNLAIADLLLQEQASAVSRLSDVLAVQSRIGSRAVGQALLEVCAGAAAADGDWSMAEKLIRAAEAQSIRSGLGRDPADQAFIDSIIRRIKDHADAARERHDQGVEPTYEESLQVATRWIEAARRA